LIPPSHCPIVKEKGTLTKSLPSLGLPLMELQSL
jgi:hypothetical protein